MKHASSFADHKSTQAQVRTMIMHKSNLYSLIVAGLSGLSACDPDPSSGPSRQDSGAASPSSGAEAKQSEPLEHVLEWADDTWESAYDPDLWLDACEFHEPGLQHLLAADAMLVPVAYFQDNNDGTFAILTAPFTSAGTLALDSSSLFYGQPRTYFGRSGVLVGPDLVATAPHTANFDFANFRVVFGLTAQLVNGACVQPDWAHVPTSNIYDPVEVVANTYTGGSYPHDYAFLRLDRATDRQPLRIRRSGRARSGDRLVAVSHPRRLSAKVSPHGEALDWNPATGLLMNGLHFLDGSSGSMIYNTDADVLEAVVRSGVCGSFQKLPNDLYQLVPLCPTSPRATNRPIADIVDDAGIPPISLVAHPLDEITHIAALGATPSAAVTNYSLSAPPGAEEPVHWQIVTSPAPNGQPKLTISPYQAYGVLAPGQTFAFKATASAATQCGSFERAIQVNDLTNGYTDTIRHQFEVGIRRFNVSPDDGFTVESMNGPFGEPSKTYTITNPNPTPVKVRMDAPAWAELTLTHGGLTTDHEGSVSINLGGSNSKLATAYLSVSLDEAMASAMPPHHTHTDDLRFSIDFGQASPSCYVPSDTKRPIHFTHGKQSYETFTEGIHVPGHAEPYESAIDVPDLFSIDALSVDVGIWAFTGSFDWYVSDLRITLVSPGGEELPLWDENELPNADYYSDEVTTEYGYELPIGVLHIDDAFTPSPLGTELGVLAGSSGQGVWKLRISAPSTAAMLVNWRLHFFGSPMGGIIYPPEPPLLDK